MTDSQNLLILMTAGPEDPLRSATPFHLAAVGAAMGWEVDVFFVIQGAQLVKKGVAETVFAKEGMKSALEYIKETMELGVHMHACTPSMGLFDIRPEDLIDNVDLVGGATMLQKASEATILLSV
jgi:uncharacterized protein